VEREMPGPRNKGITAMLFLFFLLSSCVGARQSVQIPDYILVSNGMEIIGNKGLTAFIFENNLTKVPIEQYLSAKFKTDNYASKEFWVTIEKDRYKIIIYDYSEFEKYFNSANYSVIHEEPEIAKKGDQRKFIAISMINSYNEDCLAEGSLFQNIATKYLKNLKDEYYNQ
jgi:hypothetical protein